MITLGELYTVLSAMVPLYVAMTLAYGSVTWWSIFTPVQCAGINRFVAVFAVPVLSFHFIASNNPYTMDLFFLLADSASKVAVLGLLLLWLAFVPSASLDWAITLFSLATLPNTLVMGIPLLDAMYGKPFGSSLMVQLVVLQCIVWYTLLLFLLEYRAAKLLVLDQFPDNAGSIVSFRVESDVVSLDGCRDGLLETQAENSGNGKIRVTIRRSVSSASQAFNTMGSPRSSFGLISLPSSRRPSDLTPSEVLGYRPRESNILDMHSIIHMHPRAHHSPRHSVSFAQSEALFNPTRLSNATPDLDNITNNPYPESVVITPTQIDTIATHVLIKSPRMKSPSWHEFPLNQSKNTSIGVIGVPPPEPRHVTRASVRLPDDLHKFVVRKSNADPSHVFDNIAAPSRLSTEFSPHNGGDLRGQKSLPPALLTTSRVRDESGFENHERPCEENTGSRSSFSKPAPPILSQSPSKAASSMDQRPKQMPPTIVMLRLILQMVGRKLLRNPNTYSSLFGLTWSLISFRWNIAMPAIVANSISILSNAGLGMAMFSLGLFMALQPRLIACGIPLATFSMTVRFLTGPAIMAVSSIALGLRGARLHAAIVQAALPQGIVPFVFAREYDLHPDILSTSVIFGMIIALPITLLYYVLLGL